MEITLLLALLGLGALIIPALGDDDDDEQTVAIITDFNPISQADSIVMTIDTDDASVATADLEVTVSEGTINGLDGYNIAVSFVNEGDEPDNFETARVFVVGTALDIDDVAEAVTVDVTVDAEATVEGAQETFDAVSVGAMAPDTLTVVPPT